MNDHWFSKPTQIAWACREFALGRTLTHRDEIEERYAWRLGAIVHTLKSRYRWPIVAEYRGEVRIAHYRLADPCDVLALEYPPSAKVVRADIEALGRGSVDPAAGGNDG